MFEGGVSSLLDYSSTCFSSHLDISAKHVALNICIYIVFQKRELSRPGNQKKIRLIKHLANTAYLPFDKFLQMHRGLVLSLPWNCATPWSFQVWLHLYFFHSWSNVIWMLNPHSVHHPSKRHWSCSKKILCLFWRGDSTQPPNAQQPERTFLEVPASCNGRALSNAAQNAGVWNVVFLQRAKVCWSYVQPG